MLFQVVGRHTGREGMASVEAIKHRGALKLTLLALDVLPAAGARAPPAMLLVAGDEARLHVRGALRGFLQTERAQYISQDVADDDAERIKLQQSADREGNVSDAAPGVKV